MYYQSKLGDFKPSSLLPLLRFLRVLHLMLPQDRINSTNKEPPFLRTDQTSGRTILKINIVRNNPSYLRVLTRRLDKRQIRKGRLLDRLFRKQFPRYDIFVNELKIIGKRFEGTPLCLFARVLFRRALSPSTIITLVVFHKPLPDRLNENLSVLS